MNKLKKIPEFFKEVNEELKKINWAKREELIDSTILVVIVAGVLTTYISLIDFGLSKLVQQLFK